MPTLPFQNIFDEVFMPENTTERRGAMAPIEKRRSLKLGEPKAPEAAKLPTLPSFGSLPGVTELKGVGEMLRRGYK